MLLLYLKVLKILDVDKLKHCKTVYFPQFGAVRELIINFVIRNHYIKFVEFIMEKTKYELMLATY